MKNLRCVHIGNFALLQKEHIYSLKSYAKFYNELARDGNKAEISVFAGYILPGETGFDFSYEKRLSNTIHFTLSRGNTPTTGLLSFIWNNILLFSNLTLYSLKKGNYFIFLPSPIGVWSVLIATLLKRKRTLGIYIGGYYKQEQSFEQRSGYLKRKIKKIGAYIVEKLVLFSIKKSDYIITPSYEVYHSFSSTKKVFLTPPMMNVDEQDLEIRFSKGEEKYITFCGELRHAKGVVDLLKAFIKLSVEGKIAGYKLKIIGAGQAFDELTFLVQENGLQGKVVFTGQIKDKEELKEELGSSSIFVLPSYSEGFPRVAYECFTLGVPTILTPVGGIPFFVTENEHCLFSQPGNIEDLASKIEMLINNESLQIKLSKAAKQLMIESVFPRVKRDVSLAKLVLDRKYKHLA